MTKWTIAGVLFFAATLILALDVQPCVIAEVC